MAAGIAAAAYIGSPLFSKENLQTMEKFPAVPENADKWDSYLTTHSFSEQRLSSSWRFIVNDTTWDLSLLGLIKDIHSIGSSNGDDTWVVI